jgi:hypothetical protein
MEEKTQTVSIRPLLHAPDIDPVDTVAMSAIK